MNHKFDSPRCRAVAAGELAKNMAQSVTRRGALKKFGVGLVGFALASLGLANNAEAGNGSAKKACGHCKYPYKCDSRYTVGSPEFNQCVGYCMSVVCNPQ
jgi:hypothetical protein